MRRPVAAAALIGAALFLASCSLPLVGLWDPGRVGEISYYHRVGELVRSGHVPYRDFYLEYPPGALPMFTAPTLAGDSYGQGFRLLVALAGAATIPALALALRALGAATRRIAAACACAGLAPLLLGAVSVVNFDAWPALLTSIALVLLVFGRQRTGSAVLGLAFATKVYPVVLLPLVVVRAWRDGGLRDAAVALWAFTAAAAAVLLPFAVLAPGGVGFSLYVQAKRPLQIESLGASFLLAAHRLGLYGGTVNSEFSSQNLGGSLARSVAAASTIVLAVALCAIWLRFARGELALVPAAAAAVTASVAFGKVLSPQYLIWLVPLVLLVDRVLPAALLGVALVLTHAWFPDHYASVVSFGGAVWLVLARDLLLVALFAALVRPEPALAARAIRTTPQLLGPRG
jgi:hypothetical protein